MSYLNAYGKKRRFQEGGGLAAAPVQAGPEQGGWWTRGRNSCISSATVGGDQNAAQLSAMLVL
jgi:hypothetical protein